MRLFKLKNLCAPTASFLINPNVSSFVPTEVPQGDVVGDLTKFINVQIEIL